MITSHKPLNQPVWLLRGIQATSGRLRLTRGKITFTCHGEGQLFKFQLRKLERELGLKGLAEHLGQGEQLQLFSLPVAECHFHWPWHNFSAGFVISVGGTKLRLSFVQPTNSTQATSINKTMQARRVGKQWKSLLGELLQTQTQKMG